MKKQNILLGIILTLIILLPLSCGLEFSVGKDEASLIIKAFGSSRAIPDNTEKIKVTLDFLEKRQETADSSRIEIVLDKENNIAEIADLEPGKYSIKAEAYASETVIASAETEIRLLPGLNSHSLVLSAVPSPSPTATATSVLSPTASPVVTVTPGISSSPEPTATIAETGSLELTIEPYGIPFSYFNIYGSGPEGQSFSKGNDEPVYTHSNLIVGEWDIIVKGYDVSNNQVLEGSVTVSILSNKLAKIIVEMESVTPSPTAIIEPTSTNTATPVSTVEPTSTNTATPVSTVEPTPTNTSTPVSTVEPTPTNTSTPTATSSVSPSPTATFTLTPTATATSFITPSPTQYSLYFHLNGGSGDTPAPINTAADTLLTIPPVISTPYSPALNFIGWNTMSDGSGQNYGWGGAAQIYISGNMTLYANYVNFPAPARQSGQLNSQYSNDDGYIRPGVFWEDASRFTDNGDGTITDNLTALMWLKDLSQTPLSWEMALESCNTLDIASQYDWRLPNKNELQSLLNYGAVSPASWLTGKGFNSFEPSSYWTSTTNAGDTNRAWSIDFSNAKIGLSNLKTTGLYYIAVRGTSNFLADTGQTTGFSSYDKEDGEVDSGFLWPNPRFIDNHDGTMIDLLTGLMWESALTPTTITWQQAIDNTNSFSLGGYNNWRIPSIQELYGLDNAGAVNMATWLSGSAFQNFTSSTYGIWSSTTDAYMTDNAWTVRIADFITTSSAKDISFSAYKWAVRSLAY